MSFRSRAHFSTTTVLDGGNTIGPIIRRVGGDIYT